eukprot:5070199-Pleurochrysis_carterae.AAC.6
MAAGTARPPAVLPRKGCSAEDRLIKLDVVEANGSKANDLKQVNTVAATAFVDVKVNAFCNSRCEVAGLLCFSAKGVLCAIEVELLVTRALSVYTIWLIAQNQSYSLTLAAARQMRQGRSTRLQTRSNGRF